MRKTTQQLKAEKITTKAIYDKSIGLDFQHSDTWDFSLVRINDTNNKTFLAGNIIESLISLPNVTFNGASFDEDLGLTALFVIKHEVSE